jgi:hypothetical protein
VHAVFIEERGRPAAGDDLEAELLEPARELGQTGLVMN